MRKYGVTREQAAGGSRDVAWLVAGETGEGHLYAAGDRPGIDKRRPRGGRRPRH